MKNPPPPPRWSTWLLSRFRLRGDADVLMGDFEEEYHHVLQQHGAARARRWYNRQVLVSLPGFFDQMLYWTFAMLKNYLKVALRTFRSQPAYTAINIIGLAIGVAGCVLLFLFVQDELTFDQFHLKADRIHRVERIQPNSMSRSSFTDGVSGAQLVEAFPDVEASTRITRVESLIAFNDTRFFGEKISYVDPDFLNIFTYPVLRGNQEEALAIPNSIILTEALAAKYFGSADPVGRTLRVDNEFDMLVTGVIADVPHNSHYRFDALASIATLASKRPWLSLPGSISVRTYILLAAGADPREMESKFQSFVEANIPFTQAIVLQSLGGIHLRSQAYEVDPQGNIDSIYLLGAIALVILLLACVNYINLATARASKRMREVGMRKVLGADRTQLILQFLGESIILSLAALGLAIAAVVVALPVLNTFLGRTLTFEPLLRHSGLLLAGYILVVGVLAGSYPAVFLARFKPVTVLKKAASRTQGNRVRRVLVVTQFTVSIVLLAATMVIGAQLRYMQQKDLGFDEEMVVNIFLRDGQLVEKAGVLKRELLADAQVASVSLSSTGVDEFRQSGPVTRSQAGDQTAEVLAGLIYVDEQFLETFGMTVVAGRDFLADGGSSPSEGIIINESLARGLGWSPQNAVGEHLDSNWGLEGEIIGVVENFHVRPLTSGVPPIAMIDMARADDSILSVRLRPGDSAAALLRFETLWGRVAEDWPFEAVFLDDMIQQRYEQNRKESQLFSVFSSLAILIACLGLFGLAAFMGQQRTKEIAIRKIMGASELRVVVLLSGEFSALIAVAFLLAAPVAYALTDQWLGTFAFHVDLRWYYFAASGMIVLAVAWLTVGYQAFQLARISAEEMLRYE